MWNPPRPSKEGAPLIFLLADVMAYVSFPFWEGLEEWEKHNVRVDSVCVLCNIQSS